MKKSCPTRHAVLGSQLLDDIEDEIERARAKHPDPAHLTVALMEEVGELAQAELQGQSRERIREEAVQVIAVAVRIIQEGDAEFGYPA